MTRPEGVGAAPRETQDAGQPGEAAAPDVRALQEESRWHAQTLRKWGRMQNALIALLEAKGITSKDEVMAEVYERMGSDTPKPQEGLRDQRQGSHCDEGQIPLFAGCNAPGLMERDHAEADAAREPNHRLLRDRGDATIAEPTDRTSNG